MVSQRAHSTPPHILTSCSGEEKPACVNCERQGEACDYSIKLNWEGRTKRKDGAPSPWSFEQIGLMPTPPISETGLVQSGLSVAKAASPTGQTTGLTTNRPTSSGTVRKADFADSYSLDSPPSAKRQKVSQQQHPRSEPFDKYDLLPMAEHSFFSAPPPPTMMQQQPFGYQFVPAAPPTPGPSVFSDDSWRSHVSGAPEPPTTRDLRRLSVKSIMNSPVEEDPNLRTFPVPPSTELESVYGLDNGLPDLDIPRNDDSNALMALSPRAIERRKSQPNLFSEDDESPGEFGFGLQAKHNMFERGEYYAQPVPVRIPKSLEPLPAYLQDNPMNLLYFHHFLNHTARMLVPHDCPENPFRNLLPGSTCCNRMFDITNERSGNERHQLTQSAIGIPLHVIEHRLLNHPDPSNRVATFVEQVFPNLRQALKDPQHHISNSNLATAIMLASLEIISPQAFGVQISWQEHLTIARQMIVARGGYQTLHREDAASRFLSRWFAYLDVIGSLSGIQYSRPLDQSWMSDNDRSPKPGDSIAISPIPGSAETPTDSSVPDLSTIDCLIGCTGRCVMTLAKVADLAKQCDAQRIGLGGTINQVVVSLARMLSPRQGRFKRRSRATSPLLPVAASTTIIIRIPRRAA